MHEIVIGENRYEVAPGAESGEVMINGKPTNVDLVNLGDGHYHMILEGRSINVEVVQEDGKSPQIKIDGKLYQPSVKGETDMLLERLGLNIHAKKAVKELKAPMPGLVLDIRVEPSQAVKEGDPLVVLEAMKMENVLKAPGEAVVKSIAVSKGEAIDKNAILIAFE